jgi:hypothetical protein
MLFAGEESGISMDGHPKWRSLWQQLELEVVATIFIIAASSFLFLKLTSEMREGETQAVDEAILLALRDSGDPSNPVGPPWVEMSSGILPVSAVRQCLPSLPSRSSAICGSNASGEPPCSFC